MELPDVLTHSPVRVIAGRGALRQLGAAARREGAERVLLVTDPGLQAAGHAQQAEASLTDAGLQVAVFTGVAENPTTDHVDAGVAAARGHDADFLVGLGGGSALDCAKGINLIFTHGGRMQDFWGEDKTSRPLLPLIAVPTTAGTGSEAQSFALISDAETHQKMACGDRRAPREGGLRPRVAILDPDLTLTQPPHVAAAAAIDAIAHAVETCGCIRRNPISLAFSTEAWRLLEPAFEPAVRGFTTPGLGDENDTSRTAGDADIRFRMLLGAHLAGAAIEQSMLGAAHACANPLTQKHDIIHGFAVGLMLPHVVRFNASNHDPATGANPYSPLGFPAGDLAGRLTAMLAAADIPARLRDHGVSERELPALAGLAAAQWTARFNPRTVGEAELLAIYQAAY